MAENFPVAKVLMEQKELDRSIALLANHLHRDFAEDESFVLLGIKTRGVYLADRLAKMLKEKHDQKVEVGQIDITLYRDDLSTLGPQAIVGSTDINYDITGKTIVLVDDVLFSGRTVRAALDQIVDFGRPKAVRLLVLIDRGLHEYPIQADYVGMKLDTDYTQVVQVRFHEVDGHDDVLLCVLPHEE